jgi:O-antigen/teichoic acid export membrane protein
VTLTAARLLTRGFDLARMLTIARWLGPDEMGVYAVATLALTALDQLSDFGLWPCSRSLKGSNLFLKPWPGKN